jgi:hypothetical protein
LGVIQLLALEPVGNAIPEDEKINQALQPIHNPGIVHAVTFSWWIWRGVSELGDEI